MTDIFGVDAAFESFHIPLHHLNFFLKVRYFRGQLSIFLNQNRHLISCKLCLKSPNFKLTGKIGDRKLLILRYREPAMLFQLWDQAIV